MGTTAGPCSRSWIGNGLPRQTARKPLCAKPLGNRTERRNAGALCSPIPPPPHCSVQPNPAQSCPIVPNRAVPMIPNPSNIPAERWIPAATARWSNLATHHSTTPSLHRSVQPNQGESCLIVPNRAIFMPPTSFNEPKRPLQFWTYGPLVKFSHPSLQHSIIPPFIPAQSCLIVPNRA